LKKLLVTAITAVLMFGGIGAATAKSGTHDPRDDNPNNDKGKCTAFFNGKKEGHEDPSAEDLEAIFDSCEGLIKGNPVENGRFPGCFDEDTDEDENTCEAEEGPDPTP
jgi:hypothetical protein